MDLLIYLFYGVIAFYIGFKLSRFIFLKDFSLMQEKWEKSERRKKYLEKEIKNVINFIDNPPENYIEGDVDDGILCIESKNKLNKLLGSKPE